jgi:pimeloyl-ACP methyl ester carboxylesterase
VSSITTDQGIIHYEVYGRGKPIILLHGWLGSTGLWHDTMTFLGQYYRTYALDFWGFGESGKKRSTYQVTGFCQPGGPVYGPAWNHWKPHWWGTVWAAPSALGWLYLIQNEQKRLLLLVHRLWGSSLALPLKLAGRSWIAFMLFHMMGSFRAGMRLASPFICRDPKFPQMMDRDLSQTTLESFLISIASLRRTDLRPNLDQIKIPVMGMYGNRDNIVSPRQWQPLSEEYSHAQDRTVSESRAFYHAG